MDTPRTSRRPAALLALALAAATGLPLLAPTGAAPQVGAATTVVVTAAAGGVEAAAAAVRAAGGTVLDRLPLVDGVGAQLPAGAVLAPAYRVSPNVALTPAGRPGTGLDREPTAVREALGLAPATGGGTGLGAGTTVAVVDTGVTDSADLAGRLTHEDVSGSWSPGEPRDAFGHGTFVAGAVAGDGTSRSDRRYAGVAPAAEVVDIRVADDEGRTDLVTVLRGLERAAELDVDVVNLSLSSGSPLPYQLDPLSAALDRLWARGVVVVVPSGNDGPGTRSVTSPGSDPVLLTVGALDERLSADRADDVVPTFSGRGPAPQGVAKPDLVAPGRSLVSLRAVGSTADLENPGAVVETAYFRGSGTSFSTALVSGTVALLRETHGGDLRPDQVKALLSGTAYSAKGLRDARDAGAGGLDVAAALAQQPSDVPDAVVDAPPARDAAIWEAFLAAVAAGDLEAAASSWSQLSAESHRWAASSWSSHRWAASSWSSHRWAASSWSSHRWAGEEWEMRLWASHRWAASSWSSHRWAAASSWSSHRWAASSWSSHRWAASSWSSHRWAATWE